jgi:16S rRNA G966 N2-methylase RsmD
MTKYLIVHDGRVPAGLGAVVYHRLLRRAGVASEIQSIGTTHGAQYFWSEYVGKLLGRPTASEERLVLFGVTFLDLFPDRCDERIRELKEKYESLEIWSHRWPDGFALKWDVLIPPEDIAFGELSEFLTPVEKRYLRLSLIAARAVPQESHASEDARIVQSLDELAANDPDVWNRAIESDDMRHVLQPGGIEAQDSQQNGELKIYSNSESTHLLEVEIPKKLATREIAHIDSLLNDLELPDETVVLAWLAKDRVLLYRRDRGLKRPSLRWLIEERFAELVPPVIRDEHYGQQDAVYFQIGRGFQTKHASTMQDLAKRLVDQTTGGRFLSAALSRSIAQLANQILRDIDFRGLYTSHSAPTLTVSPNELYELIHTSSRSGEMRRTLTVQIRAESPRAIGFIYRDGGYNLQKIERMLEGAMFGMKRRELAWLGPSGVPGRLRVDVHPIFDVEDIPAIQAVLQEPRMTSFQREPKFVSDDSVIGKFQTYLDMGNLVAYAESETIGPSVAHAMTLLSAAETIAKSAQRSHGRSEVLDLFSGSGAANRLLSRWNHSVVSVDMYVDVRSLGLKKEDDGMWLRADARDVVAAEGAILDRRYDVIGLDPPHSELVEIMFGATEQTTSLTELCSARSKILVMYQGHSTQSGRLSIVREGLKRSNWPHVVVIQVEEELIVLAASTEAGYSSEAFDSFVETTVRKIDGLAKDMKLGNLFVRRVS